MIARGFKSVIWVAAVGSAALACYMLSLQVATERAELARFERQIVATKRDDSLAADRARHARPDVAARAMECRGAGSVRAGSAQFLEGRFTLARFDVGREARTGRGAPRAHGLGRGCAGNRRVQPPVAAASAQNVPAPAAAPAVPAAPQAAGRTAARATRQSRGAGDAAVGRARRRGRPRRTTSLLEDGTLRASARPRRVPSRVERTRELMATLAAHVDAFRSLPRRRSSTASA